ncbi:MAG: Ribosomal RNA-processing protein 7 [Sclerophora amabilis]|nr:MAG: Ribosomal RNA-processing protein 7 [Sclerophora amabilis]
MTQPSIPRSINGYHILPLALQPLPSFKTPATHYLYLRPHEPKYPNPDDSRTLFLVNVPIDATEAHVRYLFASLGGGRVDSVKFDRDRLPEQKSPPSGSATSLGRGTKKKKKDNKRKRGQVDHNDDDDDNDDDSDHSKAGPAEGALPEVWDRNLHRSGGTALVKFVDRASMESTITAVRKQTKKTSKGGEVKAVRWGEGVDGEKAPALGSQRYLTHHRLRYPSRHALQSMVDVYMTRYAQLEAERVRQAARLRQEPDDDGFVTVTRGGRAGPARQEEAQQAVERESKKQKGTTDLKDFYRFQVREERKRKQVDLVKKFEEDKRKVGEMKRQRGRFKVYALSLSLP